MVLSLNFVLIVLPESKHKGKKVALTGGCTGAGCTGVDCTGTGCAVAGCGAGVAATSSKV